jgi:hypothetical protein
VRRKSGKTCLRATQYCYEGGVGRVKVAVVVEADNGIDVGFP